MHPLPNDLKRYLELQREAAGADHRARQAARTGARGLAAAFALQASDRRRELAHMRRSCRIFRLTPAALQDKIGWLESRCWAVSDFDLDRAQRMRRALPVLRRLYHHLVTAS